LLPFVVASSGPIRVRTPGLSQNGPVGVTLQTAKWSFTIKQILASLPSKKKKTYLSFGPYKLLKYATLMIISPTEIWHPHETHEMSTFIDLTLF
jgi:hypothetical protein